MKGKVRGIKPAGLKHLPLKPTVIHGKNKVTIGDRRFNPQKDVKQPNNTSKKQHNINDVETVDSKKMHPLETNKNFKHLNGVYTTEIGGSRYYYKPKSEEKMTINKSKGEKEFVRNGIKNDRLHEREALAYDISKDLGMDFIPPTKMVKDEKGREGVIQKSAQEFEANKTPDKNVEFTKIQDMTNGRIMDSMDNGNGMDVAVFDFIVGNTDRSGSNMFIRNDNNNIVGIDNALSFPVHQRDALSSDYVKTAELMWKNSFLSGDAKMSNKLMKSITSEKTFNKIAERLLNSNIEDEAKFGALFRLSALDEYISKNKVKSFTSFDFANVLKPFIQNTPNAGVRNRLKMVMDNPF